MNNCSICSTEMDEPYVEGYFGILPVTFCGDCFGCMMDMAEQYNAYTSEEADQDE